MDKNTLIEIAKENGYEIDSNTVRTKLKRYEGPNKVVLIEIAETEKQAIYVENDRCTKKDFAVISAAVEYARG